MAPNKANDHGYWPENGDLHGKQSPFWKVDGAHDRPCAWGPSAPNKANWAGLTDVLD